MMIKKKDDEDSRNLIRERYAKIATASCGCASASLKPCCGSAVPSADVMNQTMGYSENELTSVVEGANLGLGCGNPTAIADLHEGEVVLDLGSGGGFDCFLAAKQIGETGRVIGVDMTPEMLCRARENAARMKSQNVEFRLGEIEHLPVADSSVDVIISNCVINLSADKQQVFCDAFRVLKPGGRLTVCDMVAIAEMPDSLRRQAALLTGCIAGAESVERLRAMLAEIGFEQVDITLKVYSQKLVEQWFPGNNVEDYVVSAEIRAVKPCPNTTQNE